jgi:mRNA interferase HigB
MVIICREKLVVFSKKHPETSDSILNWMRMVVEADWKNFSDVKKTFRSVDLVKPKKYVFNINGNKIRLVAVMDFIAGAIIIQWVGLHSDYDKLNVTDI